MRKAAFAGQFYEFGKEALKNQLKKLFAAAKKEKVKNVLGLIVPHAGYMYSGKAAASAYALLEGKKFDAFVVLGPNHSGTSAVSFEDFETPFGIAENDVELSKKITELCSIEHNESSHRYEHCIEVQLPFLQYLFGEIKIVPVLLGDADYAKCQEIAKAIIKIAGKKKICLIASSDFTHYGLSYGFVPFSGEDIEIKRKLYALDRKAVSFVEKLESGGFYEYSEKTTICGRIPITIAIEACKILRAKKARLIDYYTSGDIVKDYSSAVGYASISFES